MEDDSPLFHSRHFPHARQGKRRAKASTPHETGFDPKRTFGVYEAKCANLTGALGAFTDDGRQRGLLRIEIHRLHPDGTGLIGSLSVAGVDAGGMIIMTGSRRCLNFLLTQEDHESSESPDEDERGYLDELELTARTAIQRPERSQETVIMHEDDAGVLRQDLFNPDGHDNDDDDDDTDTQQETNATSTPFAKSSFRNPKFWVAWRILRVGRTRRSGGCDEPTDTHYQGSGYFVFSGNDCRTFHGTLSCEDLQMNNVSIKGWRQSSKAKPTCPYKWDQLRNR